jgi:predicted ribosomally synthesized peptide with SipW-like signal peptide
MKRIILSLGVIAIVAIVAVGATRAYFSDTETSTGNTFTAGTLDLTVNGNNGVNTVLFTSANLKPGSQPTGKYTLRNAGSVAGFIDIENISFVSSENTRIEPEIEAGDLTDDEGELDDVLNVRMFLDYNGDGYISTGDVVFYNGLVKNLPTHFELNEPIPADTGIDFVTEVYDWWNTSTDNQAQSDSLVINATFELGQSATQ